ncbi:MAG: hypothetical protein ABR985_21830 [Methanotrichaceae archaeon]
MNHEEVLAVLPDSKEEAKSIKEIAQAMGEEAKSIKEIAQAMGWRSPPMWTG